MPLHNQEPVTGSGCGQKDFSLKGSSLDWWFELHNLFRLSGIS